MVFFVEVLVIFLFLMVILNVISNDYGNVDFVGLIIGVILVFLIIVVFNLMGGFLNFVCLIGFVIFVGGSVLLYLWVYILVLEVGVILVVFCVWVMGLED